VPRLQQALVRKVGSDLGRAFEMGVRSISIYCKLVSPQRGTLTQPTSLHMCPTQPTLGSTKGFSQIGMGICGG